MISKRMIAIIAVSLMGSAYGVKMQEDENKQQQNSTSNQGPQGGNGKGQIGKRQREINGKDFADGEHSKKIIKTDDAKDAAAVTGILKQRPSTTITQFLLVDEVLQLASVNKETWKLFQDGEGGFNSHLVANLIGMPESKTKILWSGLDHHHEIQKEMQKADHWLQDEKNLRQAQRELEEYDSAGVGFDQNIVFDGILLSFEIWKSRVQSVEAIKKYIQIVQEGQEGEKYSSSNEITDFFGSQEDFLKAVEQAWVDGAHQFLENLKADVGEMKDHLRKARDFGIAGDHPIFRTLDSFQARVNEKASKDTKFKIKTLLDSEDWTKLELALNVITPIQERDDEQSELGKEYDEFLRTANIQYNIKYKNAKILRSSLETMDRILTLKMFHKDSVIARSGQSSNSAAKIVLAAVTGAYPTIEFLLVNEPLGDVVSLVCQKHRMMVDGHDEINLCFDDGRPLRDLLEILGNFKKFIMVV
jgi:hypothetical protein